MKYTVEFAVLLCICNFCLGLEFNKQQRYNQNTDFLSHEAGGGTSIWSKRDYVAPSNPQNIPNEQGKQEYDSQFPSLGSPTATRLTTSASTVTTPKTGLRDYVAPQFPPQRQQSPSNRNIAPTSPSQNNQSNGKRDYVAPQFTTRKPDLVTSGKVKDLINFYDDKLKHQNGPQKTISYSNILQNNKEGSNTPNLAGLSQNLPQTTPKVTANHNTTPLSFSSVVVRNKGSLIPSNTTPQPSTLNPNTPINKNNQRNSAPTQRPGSPVLPSSLVSNNRNNNQGNHNGPTDVELQVLSEELLRKDSNNAAKYITINYQEKTRSQSPEDKAPLPLLTVSPDAWNIPSVQKLIPLLDNYERDTLVNEYVTAQERNEENAFMDVIMNTAVIRHLMTFLRDKGYISPDPKQQRDFMKQLWFNLYSRGKGKISSSGFEHVFVSELKNGDVQGLHNWVYFSREEAANRANYLGYLKYLTLSDKGAIIKLHFNQQGVDKPVNTMFLGTSPELEIALYTLCFVTRRDNDCNLKLATKDVNIVTYTFRYRSKNYIGSAYPQIK